MDSQRRKLTGMAGAGLVLASINGALVWRTPAQAAEAKAGTTNLTQTEGQLLASLVEAIVPGAAAAGCHHFVDHHIGVEPKDSLLTLRYLDWPPPYDAFYKAGLASLGRIVGGRRLDAPAWEGLIDAMIANTLEGWTGPPASLFYFVARSDAIDVVYGTMAGFKRLGVDYLPHIEPVTPW